MSTPRPSPLLHRTEAARSNNVVAYKTALIVGGLITFFFLLIELNERRGGAETPSFLDPLLIALAGTILLWPLRYHTVARAIFAAGGTLLLLWFLDKVGGVLAPFIVVYVLAYVFNPLVTTLHEKRGLSRSVSSLGVTMLLVGAIVLFFLLLVPTLFNELSSLATNLLSTLASLQAWVQNSTFVERLVENGLLERETLTQQLGTLLPNQIDGMAQGIPVAARGLLRSVNTLIGLVTVLAVVPVVLYYTLKDYPFINRRLAELFPTVEGRRDYLVKAGAVVGNYLRGQLIISAIAAVNVSVFLLIFDVPFALLIGLLAGILQMIPNIGAVITNVIGILIALIFGDPAWLDALAVFGVLMGQSILETTVLVPNIMSHQVGLHPVVIILALFVFGAFLGLLGLIIAVPATALIMAAYKAYRDSIHIELGTLDHIGKQKPTVTRDVEHALEGEPLDAQEVEEDLAVQEQQADQIEDRAEGEGKT